jgi:predicted transcriptional regulator
MVNNTNKKIDGIVKKINENLSEELDRDNAEELLNDINVDLRVLKKNVEEKHKEIVDGKAKELKKIIDKNLDEDETT